MKITTGQPDWATYKDWTEWTDRTPVGVLKYIVALEAENKRLSLDYISAVGQTQMHLEENQRLRETLHQIYSDACFILKSENDVDAWGFVKSTRDTALQEND